MSPVSAHGIDIYWLPLGAGGHVVRLNGRVSRQSPRGSSAGSRALHHSGLEVRASVKPICEKCRVIKRHGKVLVICPNARHKQVQG